MCKFVDSLGYDAPRSHIDCLKFPHRPRRILMWEIQDPTCIPVFLNHPALFAEAHASNYATAGSLVVVSPGPRLSGSFKCAKAEKAPHPVLCLPIFVRPINTPKFHGHCVKDIDFAVGLFFPKTRAIHSITHQIKKKTTQKLRDTVSSTRKIPMNIRQATADILRPYFRRRLLLGAHGLSKRCQIPHSIHNSEKAYCCGSPCYCFVL